MQTIRQLLQQGWRLHQAGDIAAAKQCYQRALIQSPGDADALVYLGIASFDQRAFLDSVDAYRQAIAIRNHFPIAWNNLGNSLRMLGQIEEAESCFAESLRQKPDYLSALKNRGTLWLWSGQIERGLHWYDQGLKIDPEHAELHRNLGVIHLLLGNYELGWREYRWRWKMPGMPRPRVAAPIWQGESIRGKTILIYPEQGLGDAIHFIRVASALKRQGAQVFVQCSRRMLPLFTSAPGVDRLVLDDGPLPAVDYHASMIEVVDRLHAQTQSMEWGSELFEHDRGYLTVSAALIDYWRSWLDERNRGIRVGINWQGNPNHHADVYRSVPLEALRPLSQIDGIELINLQFGHGREQLKDCDFADNILQLPDDVDTGGGAFTDTTAVLRNLDCLVTTDTSIAHLAGATGTPVAMMLGRVPDWRWLLQGNASKWYPTMKLFRQQQLGKWDDVVGDVCQYLEGRR